MDPTTTPNRDIPGTADVEPIPEASEPAEATFDPTRHPSDPPFVPFVYDDAASEPDPDARPEPVSARIKEIPQKKGSSTALFLAGAVVAGILGALLTVGVLAATGTFDEVAVITAPLTTDANGEQAAQPVEVPQTQIINNLGAAVNPTAVAAKAVPSIVTVTVANSSVDDESAAVPIGSGSGVVMSTEGYIITNHHVVEGGDAFEVEFEDGRIYEATLIGSDDLTDLAVLQIQVSSLTPIEFGSLESLNVGDPAVAIGNPLGQEGGSSVSVGIISAFNRTVEFGDETSLTGMIQTDAAINSGSSGGALLDAEGNLIGITSAIGVSQAGPEGIGYAIPIEMVERITAEIIETGDVVHPFLGVTVRTYFDTAADGAVFPAGGLIDEIEGADSAASQAGMQAGDVITLIGGKTIKDRIDLVLAVRLYRVGDEVEFVAEREGEPMTFVVVLGQRPADLQG